jgi:hypothetical protein
MRKIALVILAAGLACSAMASPAVAQMPAGPDANKPSASKGIPKKSVAQQMKRNPCAEYGAGFVQAQGSDTCVRIGGAVGVGVGIAR